jgi:hypothetical protein
LKGCCSRNPCCDSSFIRIASSAWEIWKDGRFLLDLHNALLSCEEMKWTIFLALGAMPILSVAQNFTGVDSEGNFQHGHISAGGHFSGHDSNGNFYHGHVSEGGHYSAHGSDGKFYHGFITESGHYSGSDSEGGFHHGTIDGGRGHSGFDGE